MLQLLKIVIEFAIQTNICLGIKGEDCDRKMTTTHPSRIV
jgi:hypothetical protein